MVRHIGLINMKVNVIVKNNKIVGCISSEPEVINGNKIHVGQTTARAENRGNRNR